MPKLSESSLRSKIAELQKSLEDLTKAKKPALDKIYAIMAENRLTLADLQDAAPKAATRSRKKRAAKPAAAKGKVEAKFRDAATGATWTGRGKTPRWLVDAEAGGRSREEFRIVAEVAAA
jgi:DNA-binding protein H-NS